MTTPTAFFDACPIALAEFDREGHCLRANPALVMLSGQRAESARDKTLGQILPPLLSQEALLLLVRQTGSPYLDVEVLTHTPAPERLWILSVFPMLDRSGELTRIGVSIQTRRAPEANRAAVEEREWLFRSIFERAPIGMTVLDFRGQGMRVNPRFLQMLGYTEAEFAERGIEGVSHPDDFTTDAALFHKLLGGAVDQYQIEKRFLRKDGALIWAHVTVSATRDADGRPMLIIGTAEDIDARKRAEGERDRLIAELEDAVKSRDVFLLIASHELRTPLTPLALQLDRLKRQLERNDGTPLPALEQAMRQTQRLAVLVEQLLDATRLTRRQLELKPELLDFSSLVEEIVNQMQPLATVAGSPLVLRREEAPPIRADRTRIEQVVTNLLSNAIKFGSGKPIEVTVRAAPPGVRLAICDHGIGIALEHQGRIFGRFERAVSEMQYGGLGLGLYITRQIVEAHQGTIRVESQPGEGSTFTIELPAEPPDKSAR